MMEREWLILNFVLSKELSTLRVSVWRRLKKHGSVSIGQSMWTLPYLPETFGIFTELAKDINDNGGSAYVAKASFFEDKSDNHIIEMFNKARDDEYAEFIQNCEDFFKEIKKESTSNNYTYIELEEAEDEYEKLGEWLKKIDKRNFFNSLSEKVANDTYQECKRLLDAFSNKVYELNQ